MKKYAETNVKEFSRTKGAEYHSFKIIFMNGK